MTSLRKLKIHRKLATYPTQVRDMVIADGTLYVAAYWGGLLTFPVPKGVTVGEVRPNQGRAAWANPIHVYGSNFQPDATVDLISSGNIFSPLVVNSITASHFEIIVPAGLPSGVYGLRIINPGGGAATLTAAYTVIPAEADILSAYADELYVGFHTARQNDLTGVGLVVHRAGGSAVRTDVNVDFYVGDPATGGTFLGNGVIPSLSPNSYAATIAQSWTPTTHGPVDIYAVIQPGNIPVSRTVMVLPPNVDTQPPVVNSFTATSGPDFAAPAIGLTGPRRTPPAAPGWGRSISWSLIGMPMWGRG